jgi:hypothetical protein
MRSPFGRGVSGMFVDARAGAVFAGLLAAASPLRPALPELTDLQVIVLGTLLTYDDETLNRVNNAEIADAAGLRNSRQVTGAIGYLVRAGIVEQTHRGVNRKMKIDRNLAGEVLARAV